MKLITFASFKGGAGKTTAVMAVSSALSQKGKQVALIDADENMPLVEWRDNAFKAGTWSDNITSSLGENWHQPMKAMPEEVRHIYDSATVEHYELADQFQIAE